MGKGQVLDFTLHALDKYSLVSLLLNDSYHARVFAGRNDAVSEVSPRLVRSDQLSVAILQIPPEIDDIADL